MIAYLNIICLISALAVFYGYFLSRPKKYALALATDTQYKRPFYLDIAVIALVASFSLSIYKTFITDYLRIPSESMLPTLPVGSIVKIDKMAFGIRYPLTNLPATHGGKPNRGDVVVAQFPLNKQINYIKRIIGLPGDEISIDSEKIVINGEAFPFEYQETSILKEGDKSAEVALYSVKVHGVGWNIVIDPKRTFHGVSGYIVPEDGYFLLGDNLTSSSDSRDFGAIHYNMLIGLKQR